MKLAPRTRKTSRQKVGPKMLAAHANKKEYALNLLRNNYSAGAIARNLETSPQPHRALAQRGRNPAMQAWLWQAHACGGGGAEVSAQPLPCPFCGGTKSEMRPMAITPGGSNA
jgi:hypothetical protein